MSPPSPPSPPPPSTPFAGLRVVLVAAFNRRYHRSGLALAAALQALGCEVRRCEERRRGLSAIIGRPLTARLGALLGRARADMVLVFKGAKLAPEDVRELKGRFGGRWVNWFPDDPHRIELSLSLGPAYDVFFTHDSSSLERHRRVGARAHYLTFGCDPSYLRPLDGNSGREGRWCTPLVFVGSRDPVRERVVDAARDLGLTAWGPGWPSGPVYGDDFVRALSGATVGLNIHQHFGEAGDPASYGTGANMRVFELAAIGTPQLCDAKSDIARHFTPDREIVLYRSVAELREVARFLLGDEAARRSLAAAARGRALAEHTWRHRMEELLGVALR
jgi:spore maturation protein CgeB